MTIGPPLAGEWGVPSYVIGIDSTMSELGDLFTQYGSDKDTNHSYGEVYERLFADRDSPCYVMEIGIAHGGGILAWRDWFRKAVIVGFDKEPCHGPLIGSTDRRVYPLTPRPSRLEIHQGDMRDRDALIRAIADRRFDVIVEDATHELDDNLRTLFWLWPCVAPGGVYVVEEFANVHAYVDNLKVFAGVELHRTSAPIPNELIVAVRKSSA